MMGSWLMTWGLIDRCFFFLASSPLGEVTVELPPMEASLSSRLTFFLQSCCCFSLRRACFFVYSPTS